MADVETMIIIDRAPEEVFDHWADGRLYNLWQPAATKKDVRLLTQEPIGIGSRFRGTFKGAGRVEYEIAEYERLWKLTMVTHVPMGDLRHTLLYERVPGGTRVNQLGEGTFTGIFRLLRPLIFATFRRSFRANDIALKRYLEASL